MENNTWLTFYYVATYILALVALIGLYLSIQSSRNVTKGIRVIQEGIQSFSEPFFTLFGASFNRDEAIVNFTNKGATAKRLTVIPKGTFSAKIYQEVLDTNERAKLELKHYPKPLPDKLEFELHYEDKIGNKRIKKYCFSTSDGTVEEV